MFSKNRPKFRRTLAFRLTLWYAGIFTLSLCTAVFFFYLFIAMVFRDSADRELVSRTKELAALLRVDGIEALKRVAVLEAQAAGEKKIFVRLFYPNGTAFSSSNMSYWQDIELSKNAAELISRGSPQIFETIKIPNRKQEVRILYSVISPGVLLQLGQSLEIHARFMEAFQKIFVFTMLSLILFSAFTGWFMAKRATAGVYAVTTTARHISEGNLAQRVPATSRGDEIDQMAETFNQMLDRIEALVKNIKEMSDNIAHDLKGPITRIRGLAEITLTTGSTLDEFASMAGGTIEECDRLLAMINTMLTISKTEAGLDEMEKRPVDITELLSDACDLFLPMAEDKHIEVRFSEKNPCTIMGNMPMIQRMAANLIDNALKYTPSGGAVDLSIERTGNGKVDIHVKDTGIGISETDLPHIFQRFFRCDPSRNQTGTGLGLSLAGAIAKAHEGDITVKSTLGSGSTFTVTLPMMET